MWHVSNLFIRMGYSRMINSSHKKECQQKGCEIELGCLTTSRLLLNILIVIF
jgi:hypothetical protein